jgi:ribosomal protein S18 acetylase RimI-like enzyme
MLLFTDDKKRLCRHFRKDDTLFAYHLGDLDDFYFRDCQWAVTYGDNPHIQEVILLYTGLSTPTMLAFGLTDQFEGLLEEMLQIAPREFHGHFHARHRRLFEAFGYRETPHGSAWKMRLQQAGSGPEAGVVSAADIDGDIVRLDSSHEKELLALYERAYPDNYFTSRMLETGKYFGYVCRGRIAAVSGVHVDSRKYKTACLGNIVTDIDFRGKGLASALTSRLVTELVRENKTISLNVMADNSAAIRCYEKLGFVKVHEYEEALFERV